MRRVFGVCTDSWYLCGQNQGSPRGSMMSCQSISARYPDHGDNNTHFQRSVRFNSECRSSTREKHDIDKKDISGAIALAAMSGHSHQMSQSAPSASHTFDLPEAPPAAACRFPKLEECAHFHYERVSLGGLSIETVPLPCEEMGPDWTPSDGWVCLRVRSHVNSKSESNVDIRPLTGSWTEGSDVKEWTLTRNKENFLQLDDMLHRCIYDRKVSGLPALSEEAKRVNAGSEEWRRLVADYVHHLSIIADDSINCGPVLNWLQMDNKGHKLLVAGEDWQTINTPAVAAAYSVRPYVSQARDEISFEVGDMISIIDMPGPNESLWWRGKRGFRVGFFPHHCVAVIGDKVPRHMTQPPPIVGSVAVAPIKPVLRKHGKLISLFRSFILSRPSRRSLKQQGILKERVFGCDLGEHLLNCGHDVPLVLVACAAAIEARGAVDGIYRLSGGSGLTQKLRAEFDAGGMPDLAAPAVVSDPHAVASLLKMYFRELPNPLCTYQLYESFVGAVAPHNPDGPNPTPADAHTMDESSRLRAVRRAVAKLPPPHYRTLAYLMRHLRRVSLLGAHTGMTARNMAIVWAPNLLRAPHTHHALHGVAVQAVVTEFLICYAEELFADGPDAELDEISAPPTPTPIDEQHHYETIGLGRDDSTRRPKSLPLHPPTKLLSLEEARRRGGCKSTTSEVVSPRLPPPSGAIAAAAAASGTQLRPQGDLKPKYIEVGSGPNNLPQYHTVLELPGGGTRNGGRGAAGTGVWVWRGLFSRNKPRRPHTVRISQPTRPTITPILAATAEDVPMSGLRPVKSCESLASDTDTLAPLGQVPESAPLKHHTRSASCDSYFEPWQAELADMRLRLAPQERDHHMFSEEDDTNIALSNPQPNNDTTRCEGSLCSTPAGSVGSTSCSNEPSPRRPLRVDIIAAQNADRQRSIIEEQLANIGFIDGDSPRHPLPAPPPPPAAKRHSARPHSPHHKDIAKRLCKESKQTVSEFQSSPITGVKMRERNSPRKSKSSRYTGLPADGCHDNARLSWHGDGHSTLIKIDWPIDNSSVSNLTNSTNTPMTPTTPTYDPLESDSETSDNKRTIKINNCDNCREEKCLKCELKATDYENVRFGDHSPVGDISYQNLNRLSAVSNSSTSESERKKDEMKIMTSSHESSSSYSNASLKHSDDYESYNFTRPNYINLTASSTSKSSPGSPLKSPLKSTISITFRSPTKMKKIDQDNDTPTNDRDSIYEDVVLDKNLSIVEDAPIPGNDASLPTPACQPNYTQDLIILETPTQSDQDTDIDQNVDVYSQVKFFKKSIEEVNALIYDTPDQRLYENVNFGLADVKIRDKEDVDNNDHQENGNIVKTKNLNVRELAIRFESPTEPKGPFVFEKFKAEIKYPSLERKDEDKKVNSKDTKPPISPKSCKLSRSSSNARSLDENAFVKEFGDKSIDRRKSFEVRDTKSRKFLPDLNLNMTEEQESKEKLESITPTTENKISLIQRFDIKPEIKPFLSHDTEKNLSRERIEKYKEERRNFLREKYSSQSFRSNPEQLTRIKIKKDQDKIESCERLRDSPKFERRNSVDLGQRMRFSLTKSDNSLDRDSPKDECSREEEREDIARYSRNFETIEKVSPSYNIKDMAAMFEQKSQNGG
ncbi:rhoGAP domain-containing protein [Phthorimaea operculella]|nr:rhoGAP domain-containing protein [Phthorimaea operculella]